MMAFSNIISQVNISIKSDLGRIKFLGNKYFVEAKTLN